eukprot:TRINITY_DN34741_c1_g1_i1.p1 TRINITY_DN34741_c1_g1~~TRINITY_DN34741_c1_g1_i1.p1  ORF type:complete len:361 (+),score=37.95 TRINITY_DN34741_c1_g1_i1:51-1133(+)
MLSAVMEMVARHEVEQEGCETVPTEGHAGIPSGCLRSKVSGSRLSFMSSSTKVIDQKVGDSMPDLETCSISSELDCPVCYQHFVEPVMAGCGRHTFCRNCLLKSQSVGNTPRCPVCRAECQRHATELPEVMRLTSKLRRLEGEAYEERLQISKQEREEHLYELKLAAAAKSARGGARSFEVTNAGIPEVNGTYVPGVLPTYVGPTVYRKQNSFMFIYRWQQTHWIIAELRGSSGMGDARQWLYRAPVENPVDYPPPHGWEVPPSSRSGRLPAPEVRLVPRIPRPHVHSEILRMRPRAGSAYNSAVTEPVSPLPRRRSSSADLERSSTEGLEDNWGTNRPSIRISADSVQQTKCGPPCAIM